jgi:hypothetical protein
LHVEHASQSKLGTRLEDLSNNQRLDEVSLSAGFGTKRTLEATATERSQNRGHVTVLATGYDLERSVQRIGKRYTLFPEDPLEELDLLRLPAREIGQGAVLDLAAFAVALPEKDGRGRVAIGDGGDVHVYRIAQQNVAVKSIYMTTNVRRI